MTKSFPSMSLRASAKIARRKDALAGMPTAREASSEVREATASQPRAKSIRAGSCPRESAAVLKVGEVPYGLA